MIVLGMQSFKNPRIGYCGAVRYDSIYPTSDSLSDFLKEAKEVISNYGEPDYLSNNDTYLIEHFMGDVGQEIRGSGDSLYKLEKKGSSWALDIKDTTYTISNVSDLDTIIGDML